MPKARSQVKKFSEADLEYLAGVWDSTYGLRGLGTGGSILINKVDTPPGQKWFTYMCRLLHIGETIGFSNGEGKEFWGWKVDIPDRYRLMTMLENHGKIRSMEPAEMDHIRGRFEKNLRKGAKDIPGALVPPDDYQP